MAIAKSKSKKKKNKFGLSIPAKLHFRKPSKSLADIVIGHRSETGSVLRFGNFGIQSLTSGRMTARQIEAIRIGLRRPLKKNKETKIFIRVKPSTLLTTRSAGTRMGRGKGSASGMVALVEPGRVLFEILSAWPLLVKQVFEKVKSKFPVKVQLVSLNHGALIIQKLGLSKNSN